MSFLNLTPTLRLTLGNPLLDRTYPGDGFALAVLDTGYEGFLAIPRDVFHELGFEALQTETRVLTLADGSRLSSEGTYGTLKVPSLSFETDGFIETLQGLDEIIVGAEALTHFSVLLDYCTRRLRMRSCP